MSEKDSKQVQGEHTPGTWEARGFAVFMGSAGGFDLRHCPAPEANSRRIVACVNALPHISTEKLEDFNRNGIKLTATEGYAKELEHQRDQLATKVSDTEQALFAENQKRQDVERQRDELQQLVDAQVQDIGNGMAALFNLREQNRRMLELLCELVDIEGPQPGTAAWADKARAVIASVKGGQP